MSDARSCWKKHVIGWRASGETAKRYSERHGLSANTLGWWSSQLKRDGEFPEAAMRWAKVELATAGRRIGVGIGRAPIAGQPGGAAETVARGVRAAAGRPTASG